MSASKFYGSLIQNCVCILISIGFEDLTKDIIIKMSFENISELGGKDLLIFLVMFFKKHETKINLHFFSL